MLSPACSRKDLCCLLGANVQVLAPDSGVLPGQRVGRGHCLERGDGFGGVRMTRDLFGRAPVQAHTRPAELKPAAQAPPKLGRGPPGPAEYFVLGSRSISRDELLRLLDFEQACRDTPDHDLIAILETVDGRSRAYLVALPRNHPSRFDAAGRRDPSRAPFWRHGEVMHIKKQSQPP